MSINYKGMSEEYNYRIVEISWDGYDEKENTLADRLSDFMYKVHGYNMQVVSNGYALIEVESIREYKEIVTIYKLAKRMFTNCMKYGF